MFTEVAEQPACCLPSDDIASYPIEGSTLYWTYNGHVGVCCVLTMGGHSATRGLSNGQK